MDMKKAIIWCASIGVVIVFGSLMYYDHNQVVNNYTNATVASRKAKINNKERRDYNDNTFQKNYDKTEPNLNYVEHNSSQKITKGLKLAFNNCNDSKAFNKNQNQIKSLLGNSMGNSVLNFIRPQQNQSFKHPTSISNHLANVSMSYGTFDTSSKSLPINILVSYKTPPFNKYAGAGSGDSGKKQIHSGQVLYEIVYNTSDKSITLNHSESQMK